MNSKRGQFFILAAVLIASIVFSLSIARNLLIGPEKPDDFYLMGEQLDSEIKAVLDYELYSGEENVSDFIVDSMSYFRKTKPYTEVVFMYLNSDKLYVKNYANRSVEVGGNSVCFPTSCVVAKENTKTISSIQMDDIITLNFFGQDFYYNLSKGSKSYIVLMRNVSNEVYVDVKE